MSSPVAFRLDRWLASHGGGSRKEVKQLIRKGRVRVNDQVVTAPDTKVLETDRLVVDGKELVLAQHVYYMMNKPAGVLSATRDKHSPTVLDLLPQELVRPGLFPAGRLDKDTEGFLLLTNDGAFAHRIMAPKNKVAKTYFAVLDRPFDQAKVAEAFLQGVALGGGEESSSAQLKILKMGERPEVELTIYEGMFHQVKRMFEAFGLEVCYLKRLSIGGLYLKEGLEPGETDQLTAEEVEQIEKPPNN